MASPGGEPSPGGSSGPGAHNDTDLSAFLRCSTRRPSNRSEGCESDGVSSTTSAHARSRSNIWSGSFRERLQVLADEYEMLEARCYNLERENKRLSSVSHGADGSCQSRGFASTSFSEDAEGRGPGGVDPTEATTAIPSAEAAEAEAKAITAVDDGRGDDPNMRKDIKAAISRVRQCFKEQPHRATWRASAAENSIMMTRTSESKNKDQEVVIQEDRRCGCYALDPSSPARLMFECCTVIVCMHDAVVVPFSIAWEPEATPLSRALGLLSLVFWFGDMILNFFTGFYRDGILITDLKAIALKYLTTFFLIDIVINGVDVVSVFMEMVVEEGSGGTSTPMRILRIVKLNRLLRVMVVFNRYKQKLNSSSLESSSFTMLGLGGRLIAILLFLNHLLSCGWYWIGQSDLSDTGASWLDMKISSGGLSYKNASAKFQYLTALHWAFTQMTPGSMAVVPQNSLERSWNVMCLVIGLFVSALLISQLSAKMVRVQTINHDRLHQMDLLTRFLTEQGVPRMLAQRIRRQVRERALNTKPLTLQDVPPLALLPTTLRQELSCSIFARSFLRHSVFYLWSIVEDALVEDMSARAIDLEAYSKHDDIFVPLAEAEKIFFLRVGCLAYRREIFQMVDGEDNHHGSIAMLDTLPAAPPSNWDWAKDPGSVFVPPCSWMSLIALWCRWTYVGTLQAIDNSELVAFNVKGMTDVLTRYPQLFKVNRAYAQAYSILSNDAEHAANVDLDIPAPHVLMAMPHEDRMGFSSGLVDSFGGSGQPSIDRYYPIKRNCITSAEKDRLADELEAGKCVVTLGADCQLLRSVLLCVLNITNRTGEILVKVATTKRNALVPDVVLPGSKLREQESARETAERIINTELPKMPGSLVFECNIDEMQITKSKNFSIRTAYFKTKFHISAECSELNCSMDDAASDVPVGSMMGGGSVTVTQSAPRGLGNRSLATANLDVLASIASGPCQRIKAMEVTLPGDKLELYTWLSTADFNELANPAREEELKQWLGSYSKRKKLSADTSDSQQFPALVAQVAAVSQEPPEVGGIQEDFIDTSEGVFTSM